MSEPFPTQVDDVDVLFARLERVAPPVDLSRRVALAISGRVEARRRLLTRVAMVSTALSVPFSFITGQQLQLSGALAVAAALGTDVELWRAAPLDVTLGIAELVPWLPMAAAGLAVSAASVAVRRLPSWRAASSLGG